MDSVYVVRWGPAAGDDYSTQVFTTKARMLTFVDKLRVAQLEIADMKGHGIDLPTQIALTGVLSYEVHYVAVDVAPNKIDIDDDEPEEQADLDKYSQLICFGEFPDTQIWRNGTEQHQK